MPDGRDLYVMQIKLVGQYYPHFVYFFGTNDTKTVTVNRLVPQGKTSRVETTVLIDGKTFNLVLTPKE